MSNSSERLKNMTRFSAAGSKMTPKTITKVNLESDIYVLYAGFSEMKLSQSMFWFSPY